MKLTRTILLLVFLALFVLAQSWFIRFGTSPRTILNRENMDKPYYRVGPFGWLAAAIYEYHDAWYYPTPYDYNPPGFFGLDPHNGIAADFNCDGREDLVITWAIFPHTIERQSHATFTMLLNEGGGRLRHAPEMFEEGGPPLRHFAYRTAVADFNGDGRPDIAASCSGMVKRNPDGTYTMVLEPILLVMSTSSGRLRDASADIEGQESGGLPAELTGSPHDMSAGDVNGDGEPDFYTGKLLFLNNGAGKFLNATNQLPGELRPDSTYIMTSSIGDLDSDGIGDIVAAYAEGAPSNRSGYIMLSDGNTSLENRRLIELPAGRYGAGVTKFNHSVIMDVDQDGLNDVVLKVTRANPYYEGRTIQVLMNRANGVFVDETDTRVVDSADFDTAHGEGNLHVMDVNRDGIQDLVVSAGLGTMQDFKLHGITVYLNSGGVLRAMEPSVFPWVQPWQLEDSTFTGGWPQDGMGRGYPLDLDGQFALDIVAEVFAPNYPITPSTPNEVDLYSILSVKPLLSSPMFGLTIQPGTDGTTEPFPGTHSYHSGSEVRVTAVPNRHYGFTGWSGSVSGTENPLKITLNSDKNIKAHFKLVSPPSNASGRKIVNRSLLQGEYINVLSWQDNPDNQGIVNLKYRILQKTGDSWSVLAELDSDVFEYRHRNVEQSTAYEYAIVAAVPGGRGGQAAYVTVQ
jgi:hypothetical protein